MRSHSFEVCNKTIKMYFARENHNNTPYNSYKIFCRQTISNETNKYLLTCHYNEIVSPDEIELLTNRLLKNLGITPDAF